MLPKIDNSPEPAASGIRLTPTLTEEGIRKLREHRLEDASRIFNAALKFDPDNGNLHFLNALAYHLRYLRGDPAMLELSTTGYQLALRADPSHFMAALQLGRLELEARRYPEAIVAFQHAVAVEPDSGLPHLGLAMAAYYQQDLELAKSAATRAVAMLPQDAESWRAAAMVFAATGDDIGARAAADHFFRLEPLTQARGHVTRRLDQWRLWHAAAKNGAAAAPEVVVPSGASADSAATAASPTDAGGASGAIAPWYKCDAETQQARATAGSGASSGIDPSPQPALPAPCGGAGAPRMALLDVSIIGTEDEVTGSYGINLLKGLTYVFGRSLSINDVHVRGDPNRTVTFTKLTKRGLPDAGVTYSLNIANATNSRSELVANPSLVALDRQPSTFFSGRTLTLGIEGQAGSSSSVSERPVGVSLAVTPTFLDDDNLLLAVQAARSFLEEIDANVDFGHSMQTSRNSVSANVALKFGQTLILSGMQEQEISRSNDGVPVLKDIPGLQYLFSTQISQRYVKSILIMITPRKPEMGESQMLKSLRDPVHRIKPGAVPTRVDKTLNHFARGNSLLQYRSGDVKNEAWREKSRLDSFLADLREALYR